ncbi:MAG TPA: M56 family metallopeptidase [Candidatus Sulfotelmatobacter sp.]|nr:M56 family metallopeptidase [Candidatus Sulfotelmatobacter sp.]
MIAPLAHVLFVYLLDGVWEGALFALAAALVLRSMPRGNATTRYAVLVLALCAVVVVPLLTAWLTLRSAPATVATTPATIVLRTNADDRLRVRVLREDLPALVTPPSEPRLPAFQRWNLPIPRLLALGVVGAWLLGMLYVGLRLVISLAHLEGLKRNALPLPLAYRDRLVAWTNAVKGSRGVRLCRSAEVTIPIAVGLFDAMILVPEALLDALSSEDIDRIILHELAHLRRNDDWLNAFERVVSAVLFFNPAVLWLVARLDLEREVACDDWVVTQTAQPLPYAHCLVRVVESASWPYRAMAAPGVFVTRRSMSIRIERLLSAHRDVRSRVALGPASLAVASIAALGVLAAYVSPSIADEPPATAAAPPAIATPHVVHTLSPEQRLVEWAVVPAAAAPHASAVALASAVPKRAPAVASLAPLRPVPAAAVKARPADGRRTYGPYAYAYAARPEPVPSPAPARIGDPTQVANDDYISELAAAGYTHLTLDQLIRMRSVGVTPALIRDLSAAGFTHLSPDELVHLAAVGVDGPYVRSMRSLFGNTLSVEDVVQLRAVGVTPEYVQTLKADGLASPSVSDAVSARAVGLDGDYIRTMRARFGNASVRELRNAQAVGVTPEYADQMRVAGLGNLDLRQLQQVRALGLDADYVRSMRTRFGNLSAGQLTNARAVGLTPEYADQMRAAGLPNLSFDDLRRLREFGIDPDFIKSCKAHGFTNLSVDQLVRIRASGLL